MAAKPDPGPTLADISDLIFKHFDTNRNGLISLAEFNPVQKELRFNDSKFKAEFAKLDLNHDGSLSAAEVKAGLLQLDANHDGHISTAEAQYVLVPLLGSAVSLTNMVHH